MRTFDDSYGTYKYILPLLLNDPDYELRASIYSMFHCLDNFMNTIILELGRINEDNIALERMANRSIKKFEERLWFTTLWADYYFFLNTVERTYRLAMKLYIKLDFAQKAKEIRESKQFNDARLMRNKIEHIYEELAKHGEQFSHQYGSMGEKNRIEIDGVSFRASEDSLQLLYQIYDDISNIIVKKYIEPNKKVVDQIWAAPSFQSHVEQND